jgi:hypothetical protein
MISYLTRRSYRSRHNSSETCQPLKQQHSNIARSLRLLFYLETQKNWLTESVAVLDTFGLPPEMQNRFPDITTDQFKAESLGRRTLVERSIDKTFPEIQQHLGTRSGGPTFDDFIFSEKNFDPESGLPHTSGVGPGYENISKYFFWIKQELELAHAGCDIDLRNKVYIEFTTCLINGYNRPYYPYYDLFEGGLYSAQNPKEDTPVILLSDQFILYTLYNSNTNKQLPQIGLTNLDVIEPPDWPDEPTLR